jgi:hypothetical protein
MAGDFIGVSMAFLCPAYACYGWVEESCIFIAKLAMVFGFTIVETLREMGKCCLLLR